MAFPHPESDRLSVMAQCKDRQCTYYKHGWESKKTSHHVPLGKVMKDYVVASVVHNHGIFRTRAVMSVDPRKFDRLHRCARIKIDRGE